MPRTGEKITTRGAKHSSAASTTASSSDAGVERVLAVLAADTFLCTKKGRRSRLATPVLTSVAFAAVVFAVRFYAAGSYNETCDAWAQTIMPA